MPTLTAVTGHAPARGPLGRRAQRLRARMPVMLLCAALLAAVGALAAPPTARAVDATPTSLDELRQMEVQLRELVRQARAATVAVQLGTTHGSGVIISPDGYVLTASHVAGEPGRDVWITTARGQRVRGRTLGSNRSLDAALLHIEDAPPARDLQPNAGPASWPYAPMGTASDLHPGAWCLALGHPGGYQPDRQAVARFGRVLSVSTEVLDTDCLLVGGDSGGPLFDLDGRVIGIHSRIGEQLTMNLHVPVDVFRTDWARLVRSESWGRLSELMGTPPSPDRPAIGVLGDRSTELPQVAEVLPASPAEAAGLQAGDVVLRVRDAEIETFDDLKAAVGRCRPGDELALTILRGAERLQVTLVVGALGRSNSEPTADGAAVAPRAGGDPDASGAPPRGEPRSAPAVLQAFGSVAGQSAASTVRVICANRQVALGTVFDADGLIATKASELHGPVLCELADGRRYAAQLLGVDRGSDLALLRIPVADLPAIRWREDEPPAVGSWVVTASPSALPQAVGIVSVAPHPVRGGILGVQLAEDQPGPRITYVVPGSGASLAGLQTGDVVTQVNDTPVRTADALVATTSTLLPGDRIKVTVIRHNQAEQVTAVLGSVEETLSNERSRLQDRLGGPLSARRVLFPLALEHDTVLQPRECGGPLLDLDGQAVGINIARASRVASYAIPAHVARSVLENLAAQTRPEADTTAATATAAL